MGYSLNFDPIVQRSETALGKEAEKSFNGVVISKCEKDGAMESGPF
jgi:hypothetical protein